MDMDVNEHAELSNYTSREIKAKEQCFNAVLHIMVIGEISIMNTNLT